MTDRRLTQVLRDQVRARDGGRCVDCGESDADLLTFQHRESSGNGGRGKKAPALTPADGVCACITCNDSYEAARQIHALEMGLKLLRNRGGILASQIPFYDRNHRGYFLPREDGTRVPIEPALAHELLAAAGNYKHRYASAGVGEADI